MHILFTFAVCTDTYYRLVLIWIGYIVAHWRRHTSKRVCAKINNICIVRLLFPFISYLLGQHS